MLCKNNNFMSKEAKLAHGIVNMVLISEDVVASIGVIPTFKVIFTPLEYNLIMPPLCYIPHQYLFYTYKETSLFGSRFYKTLVTIRASSLVNFLMHAPILIIFLNRASTRLISKEEV